MKIGNHDYILTKEGKIALSGAVVVAVGLIGSVRTIDAGQVGIVTRFGEVQRVADSGLTFKIPFIEHITKMDVRIQKEEVESSAATKDLQDINANIALNYSIDRESALTIFKTLGKDYKDNIILPALHEAFKAGAAQYTAEELITSRAEAKEKILAEVKTRLAKYGVVVTDLNIVNLDFSAEFNKAIEAKMVAQQEVEKAKQDLERTKIESEQQITKAKADAEAQRLQQSTLTELMIKKMYLEKWDGKLPTTMAGESGLIIDLGE